MVFSYDCGWQQNWRWQKMQANCWQFRLPCGCGGTTQGASPGGAHPELHWGQWMPPLGECLRRIALVAATADKIVENTQNTNKTQLLASNYGTNWLLVAYENFTPQNGHSTQLIDAMSCVKMWDSTIGAEELVPLSSYQTLSADKKWRSY